MSVSQNPHCQFALCFSLSDGGLKETNVYRNSCHSNLASPRLGVRSYIMCSSCQCIQWRRLGGS